MNAGGRNTFFLARGGGGGILSNIPNWNFLLRTAFSFFFLFFLRIDKQLGLEIEVGESYQLVCQGYRFELRL